MRSFLVGLVVLALSSAAMGQVRGEVESIGFGNGLFRPTCWTPMVVRLQSQISETAEYRIEVHQHDLDFDHVIYVKDGITLNGQTTQRWEICFLPEPIHGGLGSTLTLPELQDRLRVYLTNKEGTRQIIQLPITSMVQSLEGAYNGFSTSKARKLVLFVMDGSSRPALSEQSYNGSVGLVEVPEPVPIRPSALPQSPLAYQAVDAVVWISGDARTLSEEGSKQLIALQQWVRQGGTLIICHPSSDAERQKIEPFADMLPVQWKENGEWKINVKEKDNLEPLISLAHAKNNEPWPKTTWNMTGKFAFARATTKPAAVVEPGDWIRWDEDGKDQSPYIARIAYGLGSVEWVAQDLGNPAITGPNTAGWQYVWDHIFDWKADTHLSNNMPEAVRDSYIETNPVDIGSAQMAGVEFGAKGAGLIVVAIFFFIFYWIVAGPGSYLFLAGKKRKDLSWAMFGVSAVAATLLTVLVVRLVLRGSPEIHHATNVRMVSGQEPQPAIAFSRIGLYIPRDGDQHIGLTDTSKEFVSYLTPMSVPPSSTENDFPANLDYHVPVRDEGSTDPIGIDVPFRSTLKKLQAQWCGDKEKSIRANSVQLVTGGAEKEKIAGSIDNLTGVDLRNIYLAFHSGSQDYVLFIPSWSAAQGKNRIDLRAEYAKAAALPLGGVFQLGDPEPDAMHSVRGDIEHQWSYFWHSKLTGDKVDDLRSSVPHSFPILSLFDRIAPPKIIPKTDFKAFTILRQGSRNLNMSAAISAGELVVLAQADEQPLPFPLEVNGDKVAGTGTVFYQFALPLDHAGVFAPPSTK
jgi:hypothetical protein